jgi:hypothetical protein
VGFSDRIRGFFNRRNNPQLQELATFVAQRKGVEGFVEPRTATSPTTLLLVDRDGDHRRAPVREAQDAVLFCERAGIPVYDARVIGYPKRMRDFDRRKGSEGDETLDQQISDLERRLRESDPNVPDH